MASHRQIPGSRTGSASSSSSGIHHLNFPFGDTTHTKVFVGGLAWETNSEGLHRHFEQHGEILEAVVISDKNTGRSKGYGFVTFRDPESARRACSDPNPVIDGRRANCNLASLGRPGIAPFHAHTRSTSPFGGTPVSRGPYFGSHAYQQPISYYYPQGFAYPPYGYGTYGPEFVYSQNIRNTYMHPYMQVHGMAGTVSPAVYPFAPFIQPLPGGHGPQGYDLPANQLVVQFTGPNLSGMAGGPVSSFQPEASYPPGRPPAQGWWRSRLSSCCHCVAGLIARGTRSPSVPRAREENDISRATKSGGSMLRLLLGIARSTRFINTSTSALSLDRT